MSNAGNWTQWTDDLLELLKLKGYHKGDVFTTVNISVKRPGDGVSPFRYWDVIGSQSTRDYGPGDLI